MQPRKSFRKTEKYVVVIFVFRLAEKRYRRPKDRFFTHPHIMFNMLYAITVNIQKPIDYTHILFPATYLHPQMCCTHIFPSLNGIYLLAVQA